MKKRFYLIIAAMIVALACTTVNAENRLFKNISKMDGVTSVYVGKQMLKLAGDMNLVGNTGNFDTSKLLSKLTGVEVVTCDNKKYAKEVSKKIDGIIKSMGDLEIVTEVDDNEDAKDKSHVVIYAKSTPGSDIIKTLLINVQSENEPTIVALHGDFTFEDLTSAMGAKNNEE